MMLRIAAAVVLAATVGCPGEAPLTPLQTGEKLLREGKPRAAVEFLAGVPWSAPDAMAARRLVAEICTRIDLASAGASQRPSVHIVETAATLAHDASCFTEGFEVDEGTLLESCGLYGSSSVRRLDVKTGAVLSEHKLGNGHFAEGVTRFGTGIFVLTWREGLGLVLDPGLTRQERTFAIQGEGWGLTHDARELIASDGTNEIRFLDSRTGALKRSVKVFNGELPLMNINELEYMEGELLANIFPSERIARIDPRSGRLIGWILAEGLLPNQQRFQADVMNGIAYDASDKRLFLTGKLWPSIFVVRLKRPS